MPSLETMFEIADDTQKERTGSIFRDKNDLDAFLYLKDKFPEIKNIICAAEHDQIWLDVTEEQLNQLNQEDVNYLSDSGVYFDEYGLTMYK